MRLDLISVMQRNDDKEYFLFQNMNPSYLFVVTNS